MRALLQRVASPASVSVEGKIVGEISKGLVVFLAVEREDSQEDLNFLYTKIPKLRIFSDTEGKMNLSLLEIEGEILLISQFTLMADMKGSGRRPSFCASARPELAKPLYEELAKLWQEAGIKIATGIFGADMKISLINDGPVTLWLDSRSP